MCKVNLEEYQRVDYIYCLQYHDKQAVKTNFQPLEVTDTTISCNLEQRQRSSQQILDLADYLHMHKSYSPYTIYSRVSNNRDHHGTFTSLKVSHITLLLANITHTRGACAARANFSKFFL